MCQKKTNENKRESKMIKEKIQKEFLNKCTKN